MRIFLSCLQSLRPHRVAAFQFWEKYFKRGIEEAGHTWLEADGVDWAEGLTFTDDAALSRWRERTWSLVLEALRNKLRDGPVDLFLGYLYPGMVESAAVREIQRLGIPCVNFFCDNVREFRKLPETFGCFDLHWVPEYEALSLYERAGFQAVLAPMPCWVKPQQRSADHPESKGVTFIGSHDVLRRHLLGSAISLGTEINIAGSGWKSTVGASPPTDRPRKRFHQTLWNQLGSIRRRGLIGYAMKFERFVRPLSLPRIGGERLLGKVSDLDYVRLTQQSSVCLGINRVQTFRHSLHCPPTYSRLRDIEAPMMGACYLTEWTEGLSHFYELGRDIETYRTPEELAEKIRELLADPARRRQLRRAGQRRALEELCFPRTLKKITEAVGIGNGCRTA